MEQIYKILEEFDRNLILRKAMIISKMAFWIPLIS